MNQEMTTEFVEYLRKSMMAGTGINMAMIDATADVEFSRSISVLNSNFVRSVIVYQKEFTPPFNKLMQTIYKNEYRYLDDEEKENEDHVDFEKIVVQFPSPATLAMTAMTEQITVAEQAADFISNTLVPQGPAQDKEIQRLKLKAKILEDLVAVDWEKYKQYKEDIEREDKKDEINKPKTDPNDPYSGMGGAGF